jgi:hypothetical protein
MSFFGKWADDVLRNNKKSGEMSCCLDVYWPEYLFCICQKMLYIPVHMRNLKTPILYCDECKRTVQFGVDKDAVEYQRT